MISNASSPSFDAILVTPEGKSHAGARNCSASVGAIFLASLQQKYLADHPASTEDASTSKRIL
jgi:hypothetical protein